MEGGYISLNETPDLRKIITTIICGFNKRTFPELNSWIPKQRVIYYIIIFLMKCQLECN